MEYLMIKCFFSYKISGRKVIKFNSKSLWGDRNPKMAILCNQNEKKIFFSLSFF